MAVQPCLFNLDWEAIEGVACRAIDASPAQKVGPDRALRTPTLEPVGAGRGSPPLGSSTARVLPERYDASTSSGNVNDWLPVSRKR